MFTDGSRMLLIGRLQLQYSLGYSVSNMEKSSFSLAKKSCYTVSSEAANTAQQVTSNITFLGPFQTGSVCVLPNFICRVQSRLEQVGHFTFPSGLGPTAGFIFAEPRLGAGRAKPGAAGPPVPLRVVQGRLGPARLPGTAATRPGRPFARSAEPPALRGASAAAAAGGAAAAAEEEEEEGRRRPPLVAQRRRQRALSPCAAPATAAQPQAPRNPPAALALTGVRRDLRGGRRGAERSPSARPAREGEGNSPGASGRSVLLCRSPSLFPFPPLCAFHLPCS